MHFDPESIEQIDAMRMGTDYKFRVTVRGFSMALRVLSIAEVVEVANEVSERLRNLPEVGRHRLTEHTLLAQCTLVRASTSDPSRNDPKLTDLICQRMTPDELHFIFKQYNAGVDRVDPSLERLTPAELDALVAQLKKNNPDPEVLGSRLIELSFSQLVSLAHFSLTNDD